MEVFLYGNLGKTFGKKWSLHVSKPIDVFKAIDANKEGLIKYLSEKEKQNIKYRVFLDKKPITGKELEIDSSKIEKMHVVPVFSGSDTSTAQEMRLYGGIGMAAGWGVGKLGDWMGRDSFWGGLIGGVGDILFEIGTALLIQGIIGSLMDEPEEPTPGIEQILRSSTSFVFSNPANNVVQGARVPVGYGRLRVGSHVVSSSVLNCRMAEFNEVLIQENTETSKNSGKASRTAAMVVAKDRLII